VATFTDKQQTTHRKAFIEDLHLRAWGARCNADFIAKSLDELLAEHARRKQYRWAAQNARSVSFRQLAWQ